MHDAQVPVVLEGLVADWPALGWTWEALERRAGAIEVQATRLPADGPYLPHAHTTCEVAFRDVLDSVTDGPRAGGLMVTATDTLIDRVPWLREGIRPVPGRFSTDGGVGVWVSPAGHTTPLHYDLSTTLLVPVLGRKRVVLAPPEAPVWSDGTHWAAPVDLEDPDNLARHVEIGPGDALCVPVGWWHQVTTLEPTLMFTLARLEGYSNRFDAQLQ